MRPIDTTVRARSGAYKASFKRTFDDVSPFVNGGPCFDIGLLLFSRGCGALVTVFLIVVLAFTLWSSSFVAATFCPALGLSMALFMAVFALYVQFFAFFCLFGLAANSLRVI